MLDSISTAVQQTAANAQASNQTLNANFDTFLTLLTTQLQNQDPLSPMDTSEFTNQLVLYSQTEQQIRTNAQLEKLLGMGRDNIGVGTLNYIGKEVTYGGNTIYKDAGGSTEKMVYALPSAAKSMTITVQDKEGLTIREIKVPAGSEELAKGIHDFQWDGLDNNGAAAPKGDYSVKFAATGDDGKTLSTTSLVKAKVYGVESSGDGTFNLILAGNRSIDMAVVNSVQLTSSSATTPAATTTTTQQDS